MENFHFLSGIGLAKRWGISPKTLQQWRSERGGQAYLKSSKRVTYLIEDIDAWRGRGPFSET